jgi:hypothetical protein
MKGTLPWDLILSALTKNKILGELNLADQKQTFQATTLEPGGA